MSSTQPVKHLKYSLSCQLEYIIKYIYMCPVTVNVFNMYKIKFLTDLFFNWLLETCYANY